MSGSETLRLFILRHGQSELNHENIFCGWIDAHLTEKGVEQACLSAQMIKSICNENNIELPRIAYTSRLVRTQETIEAISRTLGLEADFHVKTGVNDALECLKTPIPNGNLKVIQSWRLNERHYGSWQGQRKPTVLEGCGKDDYMYIRRDYYGRPPPADLVREMVQEVNEKGTETGYDFKEPNRKQKYGIEESAGVSLPNSESLHDVVQRFRPFLLDVIVATLKQHGGSAIVVGHGSTVRSLLKILQNISDKDIKEVNIPNGMPLVVELNSKDNSFVRMYYLDPESAKLSAERVRNEGFL